MTERHPRHRRRSRRRSAALVSLILVGVVAPAWSSDADVSAPVVSVAVPGVGSTVSGRARLGVSAIDDVAVTEVKWYVDGAEVDWDGAAPFAGMWDTLRVPDGRHSVVAKAADAAGNWGTSEPITVNVANAQGWELAMSDDFASGSVDTRKWRVYGPNWPGNAGFGLRDGRAVSVVNGRLVITAQMIDGVLVSGAVASRVNLTYGRFEFRVKSDPDPSRATSAVVLTWPQSENWPIDGEKNIYETGTSVTRSPLHSFIHYGATNRQYAFDHDADGTRWHHMAMEWEPDVIRIYLDGVRVATITDPAAIARVPHHLCIQLDAFKPLMTGVVRMQVDDVRIYRRPGR